MKNILCCILDVLGIPLFLLGCLFTNLGKFSWAQSDRLQGREVRVR